MDITVWVSYPLLKRLFPSLTSAFCFSGFVVGGVFFHMKYKQKNEEKSHQKDVKDKSELDRLA